MNVSRLLLCLLFITSSLFAQHLLAQQQNQAQKESPNLNVSINDSLYADHSDTSIKIESSAIDRISSSALDTTSVVKLNDSVQTAKKAPIVSKPISAKAILIPTAMIGYGAFALSNKELKRLNLTVRKGVWENRNNGNGRPLHIDDFTLAAPAVAVYALNIAGVKGKNNFVDRSLIYGMSILIGNGAASSIKRIADVVRPDSSNTLSFPSGHTTKAFIAAEFMRQEYKHLSPWYGIAAYTVAAGTGFLRMYNNKHWFNDVVAGAGVGILSTRLSYWLYPKLKNVFVKDKKEKNSGTVFMPTYQNGAFGVGLVHSF
jgi:hypothetical protein